MKLIIKILYPIAILIFCAALIGYIAGAIISQYETKAPTLKEFKSARK